MFKVQYFKMKNTWLYDETMQKLPVITKKNKVDKIKKLQFVFIIFKHCETKNCVVEYLGSKSNIDIEKGMTTPKSS
jgi:hypothetical protein